MAKQKSSSQPSEPAEEMASDVVELDRPDLRQPVGTNNARTSSEVVDTTAEAYRQDIAVDLFRTLAHGIRIEMKPDQAPGSFAQRVMEVHAELMLKAEQAGIIPKAAAE